MFRSRGKWNSRLNDYFSCLIDGPGAQSSVRVVGLRGESTSLERPREEPDHIQKRTNFKLGYCVY